MHSKIWLSVAVLAGLSSTGLVKGVIVNTVALSGTAVPSPQYSGEAFTTTFGQPSIDVAGDSIFTATTTGAGAVTATTANGSALENNLAIYYGGANPLTLAAHGAAYAPNSAGTATSTANSGQFLSFTGSSSLPALDANGNVFTIGNLQTYTGSVDSSGTTITSLDNTGYYSSAPTSGTLAKVVRTNDPAATGGSGYYKILSSAIPANFVNEQNGNAFAAIVTTGTSTTSTAASNAGLLVSVPGSGLSIVAYSGSSSPVTSQTFVSYASGTVNLANPVVNSSGQVEFKDTLSGNSNTNVGIFSTGGGTLHAVDYTGQSAPLVNNGNDTFTGVTGTVDMNNAGQVVFAGILTTGVGDAISGSAGNNYVLYVETPSTSGGASTYTQLARKGDAAPGFGGGVVLEATNNPFNAPAINHNGMVAYSASVSGTGITTNNSNALYEYNPSTATTALLLQSGTPVPGTTYNPLTASYDQFGSVTSYYLNATGLVVFADTLEAGFGNTTATNNTGIWAVDPFGNIIQLIRKGETGAQFGLTGTLATEYVTGFSSGLALSANSGGEDGRNYGLNDNGQVPIEVNFSATLGGTTNYSGEFTVSVPEPASMSVLAVSGIGLLSRRRRRRV